MSKLRRDTYWPPVVRGTISSDVLAPFPDKNRLTVANRFLDKTIRFS